MNSKELNFFPVIYPDELFYSVCSRYAHYTPYKGMDKLREELFGYPEVRLSLKFACRLTEFCSRTGGLYSPQEILYNHTVYPYFSPFLSRDRQNRTLQAISKGNNNLLSIVGALRLSSDRNRIRYCPECAREDLEKYQECFLHTIHHLDGIDYCPKHLVRLLDYPLPRCFSLENNTIVLDPDKINSECIIKGNEAEEKLARIAGEIMGFPYNLYAVEDILTYLKAALREKEMADNRGIVHAKVYAKIVKNFPESFLEENNLLLSPDKFKTSNYLRDLFRNRSSARPVVYLVLISLVADSFNDFITIARKAMKEERFPEFNICRNPFCPDFNRPTARRLSVKGNKKAVYRCHCGQIYSQYNDGPQHYHIVQWGSLYGSTLINRVKEGASWKELEKKTGLTRKGLIKQVDNNDFTPVDDKLLVYENNLEESHRKNIQENLPLTNPQYYLSRKFVKTYDPDFLEIFNNKVVIPPSPVPRTTDFNQKDEFYYNQVTVIAEKLYKESPPVWVSQKRIISYCTPKITESAIRRLSRTKEALVKLSESHHEFGLRKIIIRIKELMLNCTDQEFTEKNVRKALGMSKGHFEVFWPEVYNFFTFSKIDESKLF